MRKSRRSRTISAGHDSDQMLGKAVAVHVMALIAGYGRPLDMIAVPPGTAETAAFGAGHINLRLVADSTEIAFATPRRRFTERSRQQRRAL